MFPALIFNLVPSLALTVVDRWSSRDGNSSIGYAFPTRLRQSSDDKFYVANDAEISRGKDTDGKGVKSQPAVLWSGIEGDLVNHQVFVKQP